MKITKNIFSIILTSALMLSSVPLLAQKATSMRINEVMVVNTNNFVDQYGNHNPWIELYNSSAGTVDIRGCYLTDDPANLTKYMIPRGDVLTQIHPRQHVIFWADGNKDRGTFHLNFTLDPTKSNFIALVDADGKTIIDSISTPVGLTDNVSFARKLDGAGELGNSADAWHISEKITPSTNNVTLDSNEKLNRLKTNDPTGIIMTITAISVVFLGLILLSNLFRFIGWAANRSPKRKQKKAEQAIIANQQKVSEQKDADMGEINAAIALALYEEMGGMHDAESYVLTFVHKRTSESDWNSKGQTMRQRPQYKSGY